MITFTNKFLQESKKLLPLVVNVQDLEFPQKPSIVQATDSPDGISLLIGNKEDKRIIFYEIYRQNNT